MDIYENSSGMVCIKCGDKVEVTNLDNDTQTYICKNRGCKSYNIKAEACIQNIDY